ncbi:MAG: glucosyltransferase domain-containing protein, partial [Acetobacter orientalis]|uniref:glucosyltransferase domain-containing protein n=1 Tax=Acetobacter orientalis TaxID=146474 RepID=UPI0039EC3795
MYYILPDENKNLYKYLINKADHFRSVFIASVLSYFFVYGFEITHFTLSIDEEFLNNFTHTVSLGRWGHALLKKYLLPEPYIPFFSITFCLLTLSISATLSTYYLRLNRLLSYVFVIMMAALPQMAYQIEFENQVDTIAISFLLSTLSNIVFEHRSRFRVVL